MLLGRSGRIDVYMAYRKIRHYTKLKREIRRTHRELRRHQRRLHKQHIEQLGWHKKWKHWRYKNTTLLIVSMFVFFVLATTEFMRNLISMLGSTGYLGAFLMGALLVSVFTAAPAIVVLFNLANHLPPVEIALLAGAGAVVGDYVLFRYLKDNVFEELAPLFRKVTTHRVSKLFYTPYFMWLTPILGAIIIASPGPDEIGIGLLGLSKIKEWQFILMTFALNFTGILITILVAQAT